MLVSVVLPVYKTEKYLQACVNSVLGQTYSNLEIILCDDGSPDNCPELCDSLALTDDRIKVVHKSNGGLSSARNAGIEVATGDHIMFVDSDDTLVLNAVEKSLRAAMDTNADITSFNVNIVRNECTMDNFYCASFIANDSEAFRANFAQYNKEIFCPAWNKMYKLSFLNDNKIRFDETVFLSEDFIFNFEAFSKTPIVCHIEDFLYNYFQHENDSITRAGRTDIIQNSFKRVAPLERFLKANNFNSDEIAEYLSDNLANAIYNQFMQAVVSTTGFGYKDRVRVLKDIYNNKEYYGKLVKHMLNVEKTFKLAICRASIYTKITSIIAIPAVASRWLRRINGKHNSTYF